jgi:Flp pilus assembly protein TadG
MRLAPTHNTHKRRGVAIYEFAIVCILCLMVLFGVVEFGRAIWIKQLMENAAREGARYAVVHTHDKTTADVQAYVRTVMVGQDLQLGATITVYKVNPNTGANLSNNWNDAGFGEAICVQVTGTFRPLLPKLLFLPSSISFTSKSVMYSEAN